MITKSDWQTAYQELTVEERRMLGEPPTAEEMLAYSRGELSAENASRVRVWLVCNPDLARALMQPFPDDDAQPGDPDFLSQDELSRHWKSLQQRIHSSSASARVAVSGAMDGVGRGHRARIRRPVLAGRIEGAATEPRDPRAARAGIADAPARRQTGCGAGTSLTAKGDHLVLDLALFDASRFETYRVEMTNDTAGSSPWRSAAIRAADEETLSVDVSRAFLKPGKYKIVVYGIEGGQEKQLDSYTLRVPER